MIDDQTVHMIASAIDYLGDPRNAIGIWFAVTGIIAAGHLLTPLVL